MGLDRHLDSPRKTGSDPAESLFPLWSAPVLRKIAAARGLVLAGCLSIGLAACGPNATVSTTPDKPAAGASSPATNERFLTVRRATRPLT